MVGEQVKRAYISSFKVVFYVTIPFSIILILAACFVPNMEKFLGNNVAKRLQNMKGGGAANVKGESTSEMEMGEKKTATPVESV